MQALAIAGEAPPADRVRALWGAGMLAWARGDFARAEALGREARALAEAHELVFGTAAALYLLHISIDSQGRYDEAIAVGEASAARMRQSGERSWLASVLADVGTRLAVSDDRERGEAWIAEGLALHRELGNKQGIGNKLNDLGMISQQTGDAQTAARQCAESLRYRGVGLHRRPGGTRQPGGAVARGRCAPSGTERRRLVAVRARAPRAGRGRRALSPGR